MKLSLSMSPMETEKREREGNRNSRRRFPSVSFFFFSSFLFGFDLFLSLVCPSRATTTTTRSRPGTPLPRPARPPAGGRADTPPRPVRPGRIRPFILLPASPGCSSSERVRVYIESLLFWFFLLSCVVIARHLRLGERERLPNWSRTQRWTRPTRCCWCCGSSSGTWSKRKSRQRLRDIGGSIGVLLCEECIRSREIRWGSSWKFLWRRGPTHLRLTVLED